MRFLADMGISPRVVQRLRDEGYDAVHLHEEELDRVPDALVLEKARIEQRILLTHDLDFGHLLALSGSPAPDVVLFRLKDMSANSVYAHLSEIIPMLPGIKSPAFVVVADSGTRVRQLPMIGDQSDGRP